MPDAPRLSVVIPTCNRLEILQQCLACLEAQTLPRELFEVLLVDDASTDATPAFLEALRTPLQVRLFRQAARGGPARARNVGIRAARGEFILFLNDDALMEPGGLQTHLETHLALPAYRLSVLGRFDLPAAFRSRLWGFTLTHSDLVFDYGVLRQDTLYGGSHYYTCNISTPRQALLDCGLFDERFTGELWGAEDIEIGHRLASLDPPVGVLFREGCAAEHRHELNVTDFGRMFRVRGGGAVHMFVRHRDMTVHYRDIRAADIRFWRALPEAVTRRVEALQALLRATESMRLPLASPASGNTGEAGAVLPPQGLKERDFPALYRDGLSLWRLREDRLIPLLDARLEEVRRTLEAARKGQCSMQAAARGIYPACLYLRWHHDTEGVCASPAIGEICKEPLELNEVVETQDAGPPPVDAGTSWFVSVVAAAYNAAPWIDTMLTSLAQQSIGFAGHIQVVVVDDGSTDETAAVVRRWVERFPRNILLLQQENAGPAAARNLGLAHATGEWISCVDADDFLAPTYFQTVRDFLAGSDYQGDVVACNTLLFHEAEQRASDGHPLAYKFQETRVVDLLEEPDCIQLFVNACLVRRQALEATGLRFDVRVRPTFEDAHFLNLLLLRRGNFRVAFLKEAHYLYRKRGGGLVEGGWASPAKYRDQILFGYLDLVQQYQRALGQVPAFVQNLVLYEVHWYLVRLLEGALPLPPAPDPAPDAAPDPGQAFLDLMALLFRHVDARHLLLSTLPALEWRTRVAMLGAFKGVAFAGAPFVLEDVAPGGGEAQVRHWVTGDMDGVAYVLGSAAGEAAIPWQKSCVHGLGRPGHPEHPDHPVHPKHRAHRALVREWRGWIPLPEASTAPVWPTVRPKADAEPLRPGVLCRGQLLETLDRAGVAQAFHLPPAMLPEPQRGILAQGTPTRQGWVLMDRVHKADDNAEHLCRWLLREHPELPVQFVLDRKSRDWPRLEREGFPLLAYHSREHFLALAAAAWLVSSHVDPPVADPLGTRDLFGLPPYRLAFLQHGIIKDDLSRWLNQIRLDMLVTSAQQEYESLLGGRYKFTRREVVLTGLPRHDALLHKARERAPGRTILFCPTWREHLRRTEAHVPGLPPEEARHFQQSDFFRAWSAVTGSRSLARLAREHGYKLLFLPHPEVTRFLPLFPRSEAFSFLEWGNLKSVQEFLVSCAVGVTDYSSLAFELGYLGRPVAYYQFPETPDIYAAHVWQRGYFDCETHGLGPVLPTVEALEAWLDETMRQGGRRQEPYEGRAAAFFTLRDGQNCRRVYEAILARTPA